MATELASLLEGLEIKVAKIVSPSYWICEFNGQELKVCWTHKRNGFLEKFNTRWITFDKRLLDKGVDFLLARIDGGDEGDYYGAWYSDAIKLNHMNWVGRGGKVVIAFSTGIFEKGKLSIYQRLVHGRRQGVLL